MVQQHWKIVNTIAITLFHAIAVYGVLDVVLHAHHLVRTILFILFVGDLGGFGVTAGVHRLWCHRSYKATTGFRVFLALCFSIAGQNTIFDWVRDHRVHHKYSDTDADPHNATRGFWFSHVGWLMMNKHPEVLSKGKTVNMKDIVDDPVVKWHTRFFIPLKVVFCFVLPTYLHMIVCDEPLRVAIMSQVFVRYALSLNFTWLVNSAAHKWGNKPYDINILPCENKLVAICAIGEGWHNYHHAFPYDYKTAELGDYRYNFTTAILDAAQYLGLVYDCKQPSRAAIEHIIAKRGPKRG